MIRNPSIVVVLSLFALPLPARAQDACKADAEKLCKGITPGAGRIIACLKSHESELSPACKEKLAAEEARFEMPTPLSTTRMTASPASGAMEICACPAREVNFAAFCKRFPTICATRVASALMSTGIGRMA
jgi:hypothetical protein